MTPAQKARVEAALALRRWDEAVEAARQAVAQDPTVGAAHALLAQSLVGAGKPQDALAAVEGGLKVWPDSEWLHRLRSIALRQLGRHAEALAAADEAVRLAPQEGHGHYLRARVLRYLGKTNEAREEFQEALKLRSDDPDYHRELGDLLLRSEPDTAEAHYRRALSLEPNDAVALNNLGVALQRLGDQRGAAAAFKSAMLVDPTLRMAKRNLHGSVGALLGVAGGGGMVIAGAAGARLWELVFAKAAAHSPTVRDPDTANLAALLVTGVATLAILAASLRRRSRRRQLERSDPQLVAIYKTLRAEKRKGRL